MADPAPHRAASGPQLSPPVVAVVAGFGLVAVVVRFVTSSPFWLDEALSVEIARLPLGAIGGALRHDGHPPLYYWLLHGWMALAGDGDTAVRALSGIAGAAALPLAWLAGRRVAGRDGAWAALLLVGVSPYAVRYSTEARMYALVMVLVLAGHVLVRRAVDDRQASRVTLAGVAAITGALVLTHYWALVLGASTVLVLAWWARRSGPGAARRTAVHLIAAMAIGAVAFVPWVPSFLHQAAHTATPWAAAARPTVVVNETLRDFGGGGSGTEHAEASLLEAGLVVLIALGLFGRTVERRVELDLATAPGVRGEATVAALTIALGSAVGLLTASTFASRYAAVVFPLVALVAARGLAVLPPRAPRAVAAAAVVVLAAAGIVGNVRDQRTQAGDLAAAIAAEARSGDVVVVCPDQLGPALRRALDTEGAAAIELLAYPALDDGRRVDWVDYAERNDAADPVAVAAQILERVPASATVWLAADGTYRTFEGDCEALGGALGASRPGRQLVVDDAERFFEHAGLVAFGPTE